MSSSFLKNFLTEKPTEILTQSSVWNSVSPRPQFSKQITHLTKAAFRSFLQTTRPQRHRSGGLQKRLQAKDQTYKHNTAAGGGLTQGMGYLPLIHKY